MTTTNPGSVETNCACGKCAECVLREENRVLREKVEFARKAADEYAASVFREGRDLKVRAEKAEAEAKGLREKLCEAERRGFEKMRLAVVLFFQEKLEAARQQESKNGIVLFEAWQKFFEQYKFDGGTHHVS